MDTHQGPAPPKKKNMGIRLDPDLREWLAEDATRYSRTVSDSIRHYIRQARERAA